MRLITFEQAVNRLKLSITPASPATAQEDDLRLAIEQAEALVLDFVNQRRCDADLWQAEVDAWNVADASALPPPQVIGAVFVQLAEIWRFRGDDVPSDQPVRGVGEVLHPMAAAYLQRHRDPAIA